MCWRGITSVPSSEQFERDGLFYTVDEGSQSWWFWVLYRGQRDLFQFLEDVSPLTQEASSVLTIWKGVAGFETLCGSVLTESLRTLVSSEFLQLPSDLESPWPAWLRTLISSITQSFPFISLWQRHWNWWYWYHYSVIWWMCNLGWPQLWRRRGKGVYHPCACVCRPGYRLWLQLQRRSGSLPEFCSCRNGLYVFSVM